MAESIELSIGKLTAQVDMIVKGMEDARQSRKEQYQAIEGLRNDISGLINRTANVEKQMLEVSPTVAEFIAIKHKVNGAGVAGRGLWLIGGVLIGAVAWLNGAREWLLK